MTLWRMQFRCLLIVVFVQLCAVCCYAATSSDLTLKTCDYTSENFYVVNTTNPQGVFPSGYVECANNATICGECLCREKKIASVEGVEVAWIVCIGSTTCATGEGSDQEYCGSSYDMKTTTDASFSEAGSSSRELVNINASDLSSYTSTEVDIINGSDASAEVLSTSEPAFSTNSSSTNLSVDASDALDNSTNGSDNTGVISTSGSTSSTNSPSIDTSVNSSVDLDNSANGSDASEGVISSSGSASSTSSSTIDTSVDTSSDLDVSTDGSDDNTGYISTSGSTSSISSPIIDPSVDPSVDFDGSADGSDASAGVISTPGSTSGTNSSSKIDTSSGSADYNEDESPTATSSNTDLENLTLPLQGSESEATNEENVITNVVGTVEPSQTNDAISIGENIIRPSDGSAHQLDTNNGSSTNSSWTGTRLTAVLSILGAIAAVAVIAVFAAVQKDQAKKNELGTPTDDYPDDSFATPMTHRLDGKYCHGSYGRHTSALVDSSDNMPLASIVVIGPDDDFHTPNGFTSTHQYRSYDGTEQTTRSAKVDSNHHKNAVIPAQQQPDAEEDPIFDSLNTQVSFASSSAPPSYEFEDNLPDSYLMVSATYSGDSDLSSDISTASRQSQKSSESGDEIVSNSTGSFASSQMSLESEKYDDRDTAASEHIYESELCTSSFDMGSV